MDQQDAQTTRRHSESGLDWFTFFCANLQTGFGPFASVYLTSQKWTQTDIGLVLTIGGLVGLIGQMPAGAIVDAARSKRWLAAVSALLVAASALLMATSSLFIIILFAWVLHAAASCVLSPIIGSMSLALVGHENMGRRVGRNASFASVGTALAAAGMGACGYYFSNQSIFFVTAALIVPALVALSFIHIEAKQEKITEPVEQEKFASSNRTSSLSDKWLALARNKIVLVTALAVCLFHLANAAMLPLVGSVLTLRTKSPTTFIATCIIIPQIMVAFLSPFVARFAESWGRRPLMLICFTALAIRGLCFSLTFDPYVLTAIQVFDGFSAAILAVLVPLIASDATWHRGGFATVQGFFGTTMGLGAAFSSTISGYLSDRFGSPSAFMGMAFVAFVGFCLVALVMPETRDAKDYKKNL